MRMLINCIESQASPQPRRVSDATSFVKALAGSNKSAARTAYLGTAIRKEHKAIVSQGPGVGYVQGAQYRVP